MINSPKMKYKSIFSNKHFRINFNTDNRQMHTLMNRFLDFDNQQNHQKSGIDINFYVSFSKNNPANNYFQGRLLVNEKGSLSSCFGRSAVETFADYKNKTVRGFVYDFKESYKEPMLDFIFTKPLRFILAKYGLFFLHASAVSRKGDAVIITGPQNSGKSTLALVLAQNGFDFLVDDDCFIKPLNNKNLLVPFPTKAGLNSEVLKKFPNLKKHTIKKYYYGEKHRLSLHRIFENRNTGNYICKFIIFPKYNASGSVCLRPLSKQKALKMLVIENQYHEILNRKLYVENFWAIYNIVNNAKVFELDYNINNLEKVPLVVEKAFKNRS